MIKRKRKLNKLLITDPTVYRVVSNADDAHCFPVGTIVRKFNESSYESLHHSRVRVGAFMWCPGEVVPKGSKQILVPKEVSK